MNNNFDELLRRSSTELENLVTNLQQVNSQLSRSGGGGFGGGFGSAGRIGNKGIGAGALGKAGGPAGAAAGIAFDIYDRTIGFAVNSAKKEATKLFRSTAFGAAQNFVDNATTNHGVSFAEGSQNAFLQAGRNIPLVGSIFKNRLDPVSRAVDRSIAQLKPLVRAGAFSNEDGTLNKEQVTSTLNDQAQRKLPQERRAQELDQIGNKLKIEIGNKEGAAIRDDFGKLKDAVKDGVVEGLSAFGPKIALNVASPLAGAAGRALGL